MIEIKAPSLIPKNDILKIFLAGSIEMGQAENWQQKVVERFASEDVMLLNPRRIDWDASWEQRKDNPYFREQVEWELGALEHADHIILYFDPHTESPISLLEMGLYAESRKLLVVCPQGFWRKGNVDIVCERYHIPQFDSLDALLGYFLGMMRKLDS